VDLATIRWTDKEKGLRYIYLTPLPAQQLIVAFDQGQKPAPLSFDLRKAAQITKCYPKGAGNRFKKNDPMSKKRLQKEGIVIGGNPPPLFRIGRKRAFGLRSLGTPGKMAAQSS
jgi:hypothetical protein